MFTGRRHSSFPCRRAATVSENQTTFLSPFWPLIRLPSSTIRVNIDAVGHPPPELAEQDIDLSAGRRCPSASAPRGGTTGEIFAQFIVAVHKALSNLPVWSERRSLLVACRSPRQSLVICAFRQRTVR